jgi:SAM-dependent methyltransferase
MANLNNRAFAQSQRTLRQVNSSVSGDIASAYDHVGDGYGRYADGEEPDDPATAAVRSAHADAVVWEAICTAIGLLRDEGVSTLRVLDAGCGPGTWTRRIAARACRQGLDVEALGFDISTGQLAIARKRAESFLNRFPGQSRPNFQFLEHNLTDSLPWVDGQFHMVVCNFGVLNHLPSGALPRVVRELCRVGTDRVIATVRALASPPTACIVGTEEVREYHQDCGRGQLALVLKDGTQHRLTFHLYSAETLRALFAPHATVVDLRAIDLFLSRFAPDANWTANLVNHLPGRQDVMRKLKEIEEPLCRLAGWVDHGTHVLVVAQPKSDLSRQAASAQLQGLAPPIDLVDPRRSPSALADDHSRGELVRQHYDDRDKCPACDGDQ